MPSPPAFDPQRGESEPSSPRLHPQRTTSSTRISRQTTRERIDEILEAARERAEQRNATPALVPNPAPSPTSTPTPMLRPPDRHRRPAAAEDGTADERTGIISRGDSFSYQSTSTGADQNSSPRNSPSIRRPAAAPQQEPGQLHSAGEERTETGESKRAHSSWYETITEPFRSIELENKGSVARDHLAIERTFLAWLRTSLAFASIGIAVTQLFRLNTSLQNGSGHPDSQAPTLRQLGKPLGATFLGISIVILFLGYHRYRESQRWVMQGKFPASRGVIILVTFLALALAVASLVVVIMVHPREKEL